MDELLNKLSTDFAESLLSESIIDKKLVASKFKASIKILISQSKTTPEINLELIKEKAEKRNIQAKRDSIERTFWFNIAFPYIQNSISEYYSKLNKTLEIEGYKDGSIVNSNLWNFKQWNFFESKQPTETGIYRVFDIFGNVEELLYSYSGAPFEPVSFCQGKIVDVTKLVAWQPL